VIACTAMSRHLTWSLGLLFSLVGCGSVPPPRSQVPTAEAALDRLRETGRCEVAIQASAKIDHEGEQGRVRGDLLMFAAVPARIRMDAVSPLGATVLTLTSDGRVFGLADFREKRFLEGAASACNIARLTSVPVPPYALVNLLRGQAPVLKHEPRGVDVAWSSKGYYVITVASTRDAIEELHVAPRPADWDKPWSDQRMRLLDVTVRQYGDVLYHAELTRHAVVAMATERVDALGLGPPLPPSGPFCDAEIPKRIHLEVPGPNADIEFRYEEVTWNPPLPDGVFRQAPPDGMPVEHAECP
jgi:hypothetical protein